MLTQVLFQFNDDCDQSKQYQAEQEKYEGQ
jgi:hypothetical protein